MKSKFRIVTLVTAVVVIGLFPLASSAAPMPIYTISFDDHTEDRFTYTIRNESTSPATVFWMNMLNFPIANYVSISSDRGGWYLSRADALDTNLDGTIDTHDLFYQAMFSVAGLRQNEFMVVTFQSGATTMAPGTVKFGNDLGLL